MLSLLNNTKKAVQQIEGLVAKDVANSSTARSSAARSSAARINEIEHLSRQASGRTGSKVPQRIESMMVTRCGHIPNRFEHLQSSPSTYSKRTYVSTASAPMKTSSDVDVDHFGMEYDTDQQTLQAIKEKEVLLVHSEDDAEKYLAHSRQQVLEQNAKERALGYPKLPQADGLLERGLRWLALGPAEAPFETMPIPDDIDASVTVHTSVDDQTGAAIASACGRRPQNEDAHVATRFTVKAGHTLLPATLMAVLDGHGGKECAEFSGKNLQTVLAQELATFNQEKLSKQGIVNALISTTVKLSQSYNSRLPKDEFSLSAGSTLNLSLQINDKVYCSNVGDSRAMFISKTGDIRQLTADQTFDSDEFLGKVLDRGGTVLEFNGDKRLVVSNITSAVPRALGDHWANGIVSSRGCVTEYDVKELGEGVIVHACDGMLEKASGNQLGERLFAALEAGGSLSEAARDAIQASYLKGSSDNMSVIMCRIDPGNESF